MEILKKTVHRITKMEILPNCENDCGGIISDLDIIYYFKFSLTSDSPDIGFFDVIPTNALLYDTVKTLNYYDSLNTTLYYPSTITSSTSINSGSVEGALSVGIGEILLFE
jgi:hypothetical protein